MNGSFAAIRVLLATLIAAWVPIFCCCSSVAAAVQHDASSQPVACHATPAKQPAAPPCHGHTTPPPQQHSHPSTPAPEDCPSRSDCDCGHAQTLAPAPERPATLTAFELAVPAFDLVELHIFESPSNFAVAISPDSTPPPRDAATLLALACLLTI